jgi:hypothetical protein
MEHRYKCDYCKKYYKTPRTLNNHIKIKHIADVNNDTHDIIANDIICEYCNNKYASSRNLKRHYNTCKEKQIKITKLAEENEKLKTELLHKEEQLKNELSQKEEEFKKEMSELKKMMNELLNKNCKMHYKTLQKINNSGTMNNGIINNNTINIVALGKENIDDVLTKTDKIAILNKKENALPYMIELVHFNDKFPQFKNIAITNNRTKQAYLYDTINKVFKMVDKEELIEELIDYRVCDIEDYYMQYKDELELPVKYKIEELIERRGEDDITKDKIKLLLFNNRHKVKV